MLQSFQNKYCKHVFLDLSLLVKVCHAFMLIVVYKVVCWKWKIQNGGFGTDFLSEPLNNIILLVSFSFLGLIDVVK